MFSLLPSKFKVSSALMLKLLSLWIVLSAFSELKNGLLPSLVGKTVRLSCPINWIVSRGAETGRNRCEIIRLSSPLASNSLIQSEVFVFSGPCRFCVLKEPRDYFVLFLIGVICFEILCGF